MAFTAQLGRVGLPAAAGGDGYALDEPVETTQSGRTLTLRGYQYDADLGLLLWVRDQILGLGDAAQEPVIPVILDAYPELTGFYAVTGATADRVSGGSAIDWTVQLERPADWAVPKTEGAGILGLLTNAHGITTGDIMTAFPPEIDSVNVGYGATLSNRGVSGDGGGTVPIALNTANATTGLGFSTWYQVAPVDYYTAGCRIEYDVLNDGTYRTVVGRKPVAAAGTGRLRLSNGFVRCEWDTAGTVLNVWWWDGSTWDGPTAFTVIGSSAGNMLATGAAVLRNSAEEVAVRFTTPASNGLGYGVTTVDLTLRRGSRNVVGYVSSTVPRVWVLAFAASTACTAITGGLRRTANNAGGNREILTSQNLTTATAGSGNIQGASAETALFCIGCEVGGSGASGQNTAAHQVAEFFQAVSENYRVVAL